MQTGEKAENEGGRREGREQTAVPMTEKKSYAKGAPPEGVRIGSDPTKEKPTRDIGVKTIYQVLRIQQSTVRAQVDNLGEALLLLRLAPSAVRLQPLLVVVVLHGRRETAAETVAARAAAKRHPKSGPPFSL